MTPAIRTDPSANPPTAEGFLLPAEPLVPARVRFTLLSLTALAARLAAAFVISWVALRYMYALTLI